MANIPGSSRGQTQVVGGDPMSEGPGPEIMAADTLEGDEVVNAKGEDLGNIKDIMIDVPSGRVAYAVLSSGGFLGIGDKLFAIPWSALTLDADRKCFVLDVDKEKLKNAPGFDKDHWPRMADPTWASEVHSYYGQKGYWTSSETGTTATGIGSATGTTTTSGLETPRRTEIGPEDV
jgi:sporulation protein YlmC with PRC-barrel domain